MKPLQVPRRTIAALLCAAAAGPLSAQGFALEGAVLDSRSAQNLGVISERGELADFFKAQKSLTFGILRAAGIPLDQLSPEVRARIERFQTTNLDAFRAFSQGLDLKDQGRFLEAKDAFRRAAELDPGFALAVEQQQAMPDVNVTSGVQMRAVIAAAASTAVDRSKQSYSVDLARAVAALQAGQTVIATTSQAPPERAQNAAAIDYTTNPPGSGGQFLPNLVAGLSYGYSLPSGAASIASVNEWTGDKYRTSGNVLESVGIAGDFLAQRLTAANVAGGETTLSDGTKAYWGTWLSAPGASAAVTVSGLTLVAPALGPVDYVMAEATRQMPTTSTAVFSPTGGSLGAATGTISVNFATRDVGLVNLGFTIGGLAFSGLNGAARYDANVASGAFSGNYSSGACLGCSGFTPQSSVFNGNFVGANANGLVFSTILLTGSTTVSGVQLFSR